MLSAGLNISFPRRTGARGSSSCPGEGPSSRQVLEITYSRHGWVESRKLPGVKGKRAGCPSRRSYDGIQASPERQGSTHPPFLVGRWGRQGWRGVAPFAFSSMTQQSRGFSQASAWRTHVPAWLVCLIGNQCIYDPRPLVHKEAGVIALPVAA